MGVRFVLEKTEKIKKLFVVGLTFGCRKSWNLT